jgi:hypothetical protein
MDEAPYPSRGRDGAHHRMLRLMKISGRMLARRGIATADVAARTHGEQPKRFLRSGTLHRRREFSAADNSRALTPPNVDTSWPYDPPM